MHFLRDALARRLDTAIQNDCRLNFKLLYKKTAGQESLALSENSDTKHGGFSGENKARETENYSPFLLWKATGTA